MKAFKIIWDNKDFREGKTRMVGIWYKKYDIPEKIGIKHCIIIYYWKRYRLFTFVTNN